MAEAVERHKISDILLALPHISRARRRAILESLSKYKINVQTLPRMTDVVKGHVSFSDIRRIQIEDLLGREPVAPNQLLLGRTIVGVGDRRRGIDRQLTLPANRSDRRRQTDPLRDFGIRALLD